MKKQLVQCMIGIAACGMILTGCGSDKKESKTADTQTKTESVQGEGTSDKSGQSAKTEESELMKVNTKYGDLYYPEQWEKNLKVEQKTDEKDKSEKIVFKAKVKGKNYTLFTVAIGKGKGEPAGTVIDKSGKEHKVYVHAEEIKNMKGLSKEEQNRIYAMKEGLNDMLDNLK